MHDLAIATLVRVVHQQSAAERDQLLGRRRHPDLLGYLSDAVDRPFTTRQVARGRQVEQTSEGPGGARTTLQQHSRRRFGPYDEAVEDMVPQADAMHFVTRERAERTEPIVERVQQFVGISHRTKPYVHSATSAAECRRQLGDLFGTVDRTASMEPSVGTAWDSTSDERVANATIVQLGSGGTVCLCNSHPTDIVVRRCLVAIIRGERLPNGERGWLSLRVRSPGENSAGSRQVPGELTSGSARSSTSRVCRI